MLQEPSDKKAKVPTRDQLGKETGEKGESKL